MKPLMSALVMVNKLLGRLPEAVLVLLLAAPWRGYREILFVADFSLLSVTALVQLTSLSGSNNFIMTFSLPNLKTW